MVLINILTKLKKLILKEHQCQHSKKRTELIFHIKITIRNNMM